MGGRQRFLRVLLTSSERVLYVVLTTYVSFLHASFHVVFDVFSAYVREPALAPPLSSRFLDVFLTISVRILRVFFACSLVELAWPLFNVFLTCSVGTETAVQNPKKTLTAFSKH